MLVLCFTLPNVKKINEAQQHRSINRVCACVHNGIKNVIKKKLRFALYLSLSLSVYNI